MNKLSVVAKAFGNDFSGSPKCPITMQREAAVDAIPGEASSVGLSIDQYVTRQLQDAYKELQWYVSSKGEVPLTDLVALAAQAAIVRAGEVATIAKALGCTDDEALAEVEAAEYDAVVKKVPGAVILNIPTAAALCVAMWDLADTVGDGDLPTAIGRITASQQADNFTHSAGMAVQDFTNKRYNNAVDVAPPSGGPDATISAGAYDSSDSGGFDWSTVGDIFSGISGSISGIKGASTSIGGAINGVINNIKNSAAQVGSSAIQDALMKKLPIILVGILVVAIVIILIAKRASKS